MQRVPVWTVYEPMDHPSLGPTCMPTGYSNPAQANWEANFLLNLNCPQPLAAFGRLMANGLWSAVAPQSLELYSLRQGLNMYLAENSMWAIAATGRIMELEGKIGSLEAEVEGLRAELADVNLLLSAGTSASVVARASASGTSRIGVIIKSAQRLALVRSGHSSPAWTPGCSRATSRAASIHGDE